jgi:hypothetical protein
LSGRPGAAGIAERPILVDKPIIQYREWHLANGEKWETRIVFWLDGPEPPATGLFAVMRKSGRFSIYWQLPMMTGAVC